MLRPKSPLLGIGPAIEGLGCRVSRPEHPEHEERGLYIEEPSPYSGNPCRAQGLGPFRDLGVGFFSAERRVAKSISAGPAGIEDPRLWEFGGSPFNEFETYW